MSLPIAAGLRVAFTIWGCEHTGTVTARGSDGIYFVKDDNGRHRWLHRESLRHA